MITSGGFVYSVSSLVDENCIAFYYPTNKGWRTPINAYLWYIAIHRKESRERKKNRLLIACSIFRFLKRYTGSTICGGVFVDTNDNPCGAK